MSSEPARRSRSERRRSREPHRERSDTARMGQSVRRPNLPLEVLGVGILLVRMWPEVRPRSWCDTDRVVVCAVQRGLPRREPGTAGARRDAVRGGPERVRRLGQPGGGACPRSRDVPGGHHERDVRPGGGHACRPGATGHEMEAWGASRSGWRDPPLRRGPGTRTGLGGGVPSLRRSPLGSGAGAPAIPARIVRTIRASTAVCASNHAPSVWSAWTRHRPARRSRCRPRTRRTTRTGPTAPRAPPQKGRTRRPGAGSAARSSGDRTGTARRPPGVPRRHGVTSERRSAGRGSRSPDLPGPAHPRPSARPSRWRRVRPSGPAGQRCVRRSDVRSATGLRPRGATPPRRRDGGRTARHPARTPRRTRSRRAHTAVLERLQHVGGLLPQEARGARAEDVGVNGLRHTRPRPAFEVVLGGPIRRFLIAVQEQHLVAVLREQERRELPHHPTTDDRDLGHPHASAGATNSSLRCRWSSRIRARPGRKIASTIASTPAPNPIRYTTL